jgi:hypothetical protein
LAGSPRPWTALALAFTLAGAADAQTLQHFASFTVTGDYVVASVDLLPTDTVVETVTGTIQVSGVPDGADILAAYLVWETIWSPSGEDLETLNAKARFRGQPVTAIRSKTVQLTGNLSQCWSNGGDNLSMMSADVLRLLPPQLDEEGRPTGKRLVNHADLQAYQDALGGQWVLDVTLAERGSGNQLPQSAGASLIVIYRDPDPNPYSIPPVASTPLRTIVLYDGAQVQAPGETTTWEIKGFLQSAGNTASLTHIAGTGSPNATERVYFKSGNGFDLIATNPFAYTGGTSDRGWAHLTAPVALSNMSTTYPFPGSLPYGERVETRVDHESTSPYDCLAWGAIVFSTEVADGDGDGLVSALEDYSGLLNGDGQPLPDLHSMGASSGHKDLFVEIGGMTTAGPTRYGYPAGHPFAGVFPEVESAGHSHMPSATVLGMVADVLRLRSVRAHFDVGPVLGPLYNAAYPNPDSGGSPYFIEGAALARGGETITEAPPCTLPATGPESNADGTPVHCRFEYFPGTMGWPTPFQLYVQQPVGLAGEELSDEDANACMNEDGTVDLTTCRQRFDLNRQGTFHYVLFAHTRSVPKSAFPCLITEPPAAAPETEAPFNELGTCDEAPNPEYYVPRSVSGIAQLPGRFAMVSLGQWDGFTGTEFMQASTLLHELSHNLNLAHGGLPPFFEILVSRRARVTVSENCKPPYFSSTNYLYQAAGLRGDDGVPLIGLSGTAHGLSLLPDGRGVVDEADLDDGALTPASEFRAGWYALLAPGTLGATLGLTAAKRHCDGTELLDGEPGTVPGEPGMGRLDAAVAAALIDWAGDTGVTTAGFTQDVNFDGKLTPLTGFDDWSYLRLNQVGAGHNMAGISQGLFWGGVDWSGVDWSGVDWSGVDWSGVDWSGVDWSGVDWSGVDWSGLGFGGVDWSGVDWSGVDWSGVDWSGVDWSGVDWSGVDWSGVANGAELDFTTAIESGGGTAPNALKAFVRGTDGSGGGNSSVPSGDIWVPDGEPTDCATLTADECHQVRLDWTEPNAGSPTGYTAFRVWDDPDDLVVDLPAPGSVADEVGSTGSMTLNDGTELPHGERFIYFVRATIDGALRNASNFAAITAVNLAPEVVDRGYSTPQDTDLVVEAADGVLVGATDADSPFSNLRAVLVEGPAHGSVALNADGSFTYSPVPGYAGPDSFTFKADNGLFPVWNGTSVPMSPDSDTRTASIEVLDATPPVVTLAIPDPTGNNGWFNTAPVIVVVTAIDGSNVASMSCTDNGAPIGFVALPVGLGTPEASGQLSVSGEGTHNLVCVATDGRGNGPGAANAPANAGSLKIDTVAPTVSFVRPVDGALYLLNAAVTASFTCADNGGSGVASCVGTVASGANLITNTVGLQVFTVEATDNAGNMASPSVNYYVRYNAVISPPKATKLGSAMPLTWSLEDAAGVNIVRLSTLIKLTSVYNGPKPASGCSVNLPAVGLPLTHYSPTTGATGGSEYRLVSGGYKFNLDTTSLAATGRGCYTIVWQFDDNAGPAPGYAVLNQSLLAKVAAEVK